jgi:hypothetical protein
LVTVRVETAALPPTMALAVPVPEIDRLVRVWFTAPEGPPRMNLPLSVALPSTRLPVAGKEPVRRIVPFWTVVTPE